MSLFDSINETNRAYCLHHVKISMFLYKSMNYTVKNELYGSFYGSYGFLWIFFTILTGVVHSGLACMILLYQENARFADKLVDMFTNMQIKTFYSVTTVFVIIYSFITGVTSR